MVRDGDALRAVVDVCEGVGVFVTVLVVVCVTVLVSVCVGVVVAVVLGLGSMRLSATLVSLGVATDAACISAGSWRCTSCNCGLSDTAGAD